MPVVREFLDLCRESTLEVFCQQKPGPFLLLDLTARRLAPPESNSPTIDRLLIGQELAAGGPPLTSHATSTHVAVRPRTERAAPGLGEGFQVYELVPRGANSTPRNSTPRVSIGSDSGCDVPIRDVSISAVHALVERRGDTYLVRDNDSTAGTQVNDRTLEPGEARPLAAGDRVTLGFVDFTFLLPVELYRFVRRLYGL